jgi:hypothetical protein
MNPRFVTWIPVTVVVLLACAGPRPTPTVPQDRSRIFSAALLVAHATGVAIGQCLDHASMLIRAGKEEGFREYKRCDVDSNAVWTTLVRAYEKQDDGIMAPCEVREAARYLDDMHQDHLPVVQDALAEAAWAGARCP